MRIPLDWLRDYVEVTLPANELAERLNMLGLSPESVETVGDDTVIQLEVTSNRGDCLSLVGVAREVAAFTGAALRAPTVAVTESDEAASTAVVVDIADLDLCPRYAARIIRGVRLGQSPDWMQRRLNAAGMRPINNIVDITNYVMLELGQPLHAFDLARVATGAGTPAHIIVRRARAGERLTTLDGQERALTPDMLLIADPSGPIALAGVMGGLATEVTDATRDILLEAAHFEPANNRRTAKALALPSEATRRFQRFVDPTGVGRAADRAAQLMAELAGGRVARGVVDEYPQPLEPRVIALRTDRCNELLGTSLSAAEIERLLASIGLEALHTLPSDFRIPTRRPDLTREIDLVEEVARLHGFDRIPSVLLTGVAAHAGENRAMRLERRARNALQGAGLNEVCTFSLTNAAAVGRAALLDVAAFVARNPLSTDATQLRTSLLPGMLEVLGNNARVGVREAWLFELARVYRPRENDDLADERRTLSLALTGGNSNGRWNLPSEAARADFFVLKGIVEELLAALRVDPAQWEAAEHPTLHAGRCARLMVAGRAAGFIGEVRREVAERFDLDPSYLAEIDFEVLMAAIPSSPPGHVPLPRFPALLRDLALVVDDTVSAAAAEAVLRAAGGASLRSVELFDVFTGDTLPSGTKSLAFALTFRAEERTLTDSEVEAAMTALRQAAATQLGARQR